MCANILAGTDNQNQNQNYGEVPVNGDDEVFQDEFERGSSQLMIGAPNDFRRSAVIFRELGLSSVFELQLISRMPLVG